jgi:hemolysin activation/secretion protein
MGLFRRLIALILISLLVMTVALAKNEANGKRTKLQEQSEKLQKSAESSASSDEVAVSEDAAPYFPVRQLRITGNNLISTEDLLEKMPENYITVVKEDGRLVEKVYDFRVLRELVHEPGQTRDVSLKAIEGLTKYILSRYQEKGYAGIYVYVPAEAVQNEGKLVDEILPIKVLEGRIDEISVSRFDFDRHPQEKGFLKGSVLKSWSPVKKGDVIQKKKLDDFVRLLNLNPDLYISSVVSRSSEPNVLNLSYDVYEANPWHWYVQVDDSGTIDRQWNPKVGFINTNFSGVDDRFSVMYQSPWEKGIEDEYSVFGSYDIPIITPQLRLNIYSGYSQFDVPAEGVSFLGNGSFYGGKISYNILQDSGWFIDLTGSFSHERSKVTPSIGLTSDVVIELWSLGVNVHRSDGISDTSLAFNRFESLSGSSERKFLEARVGTDPDFVIYDFTASHKQYLDSAGAGRISGSVRLVSSDQRLVPAKMTTFGGLYSVRGYEEDEIVADGGVLISAQYEFDLIKRSIAEQDKKAEIQQKMAKEQLLRKLSPLVFVDYGRAKIKHPIVSEQGVRELCSIGIGTIIQVRNDFSAGMYFGWPIRSTYETERGSGRLNMSFIKRF